MGARRKEKAVRRSADEQVKRNIKAVLFDFGQTLVDSANGFRAAEKTVKEMLFKDIFGDQKMQHWEEFVTQYRVVRKAFHDRSHFSRPAIWQAVYEHYNAEIKMQQLEKWELTYWETVKSETKPFPETLQILESLSRQYRLALVTNTQGQKAEGTHRIALFPQMGRFFEIIIVAGEGGVPPKPARRAFGAALEALRIPPGEAVYVGDDWRNDICGARDAGLQPIWLKHHSVRRNWPEGTGDVVVIDDLRELLEILTDP